MCCPSGESPRSRRASTRAPRRRTGGRRSGSRTRTPPASLLVSELRQAIPHDLLRHLLIVRGQALAPGTRGGGAPDLSGALPLLGNRLEGVALDDVLDPLGAARQV